jgi:hypothetical protein
VFEGGLVSGAVVEGFGVDPQQVILKTDPAGHQLLATLDKSIKAELPT